MSLQLIICGMHRSGTSLVASALQRAGLDIGRDIADAGPGNLRGHFEDQDFHQLHEAMLAAAGETCFTVGNGFASPNGADFARRARALVAAREALPLWGWKDPRTCLFLGFWEPILPQARYLFLYRHPVDVALSLWRRNNDRELRQDPWVSVRAWEVYNRRLLEFHDRHAERVFLAQVPALTADFGELVRRLHAKLGLPLSDGCAASVFVPEELTPHLPPAPAWEELIPGALALYRRLEERADLPAREATAPAMRLPAREHQLLRASEALLHALLAHERQRATELAKERQRAEKLAAALRDEQARSAQAEAHGIAIARVLAEIEGSRSFAPVRAWWRLRRWLGPRRT